MARQPSWTDQELIDAVAASTTPSPQAARGQQSHGDSALRHMVGSIGNAHIIRAGLVRLELAHINGDHTDNRLENRRSLCPNRHSTTETFRRTKR